MAPPKIRLLLVVAVATAWIASGCRTPATTSAALEVTPTESAGAHEVVLPTTSPFPTPEPTNATVSTDPLAALVLDLPDPSRWIPADSTDNLQSVLWTLDGTDFTDISVDAIDGAHIDRLVDEARRWQESHGGIDPEWLQETAVPGASRSAVLTQTIGAHSHVYTRTLLLEACGYTFALRIRVPEADIGRAPLDEMRAFLDTVEVRAGYCSDETSRRAVVRNPV